MLLMGELLLLPLVKANIDTMLSLSVRHLLPRLEVVRHNRRNDKRQTLASFTLMCSWISCQGFATIRSQSEGSFQRSLIPGIVAASMMVRSGCKGFPKSLTRLFGPSLGGDCKTSFSCWPNLVFDPTPASLRHPRMPRPLASESSTAGPHIPGCRLQGSSLWRNLHFSWYFISLRIWDVGALQHIRLYPRSEESPTWTSGQISLLRSRSTVKSRDKTSFISFRTDGHIGNRWPRCEDENL